MLALYGQEVFDEWSLVRATPEGVALAAYEGPRVEQFRARFPSDTHALRTALLDQPLAVGQFVFALTAEGTAYDACVRAGPGSYLLFNHTRRTMEDIRRDPRWLQAQRAFVELTESFHADPLE